MALLQVNDPDPLLWFVLYIVLAELALMRFLGHKQPKICIMSVGLVAAGLLISLPGFIGFVTFADLASITQEMSKDSPYIEPAREFLGTVIGAASIVLYWNWHTSE